ncbi:Uncharacterized protein BM_BM10002 [Brugia malayi]|uniref:Bm10002 n=2 Tax=Brugia TaxID=6278 RepID=A0A1U7F3Y4_BRUMA|nr:Uncharacterized protein BM_BM10002 [Brugia malayi]CRZ24501.1 Bm10002 [Brugia malayi]VIO98269.1 Uncharacterized protein BM_BM10002 [Brugia malayi]
MTGDISSAPPPYTPTSGNETKSAMFPTSQPDSVQLLYQPQHSLPPCLQKCTFSSSLTQAPAEPIIMPVVVTQPNVAPYPYQQQMSDKPVNVVVNANSRTEENSLGRDYRICNFCKRGIMKKKKDWLRVTAILLVSILFPPLSFLCCFFLCTRVIYFGECSACHRISKKEHRAF